MYDSRKMFAGGWIMRTDGSGVEVADDGQGTVTVECTSEGEHADIIISAK